MNPKIIRRQTSLFCLFLTKSFIEHSLCILFKFTLIIPHRLPPDVKKFSETPKAEVVDKEVSYQPVFPLRERKKNDSTKNKLGEVVKN